MALPLHLGLEHPSLVTVVVVGFLAFVAGLVVNLYRSYAGVASTPVSDSSDERSD